MDIKKAIIPAAGLGTRFLPLTKAVPKELLPVVTRPMIDYAVKEAVDSEINEIIFVLSERKKQILDYFKRNLKLERTLEKQGKKDLLGRLKKIDKRFQGVSFSQVEQTKPLGDGDAVLGAARKIGKEPFGVLFPDEIIDNKNPGLSQLKKVFKTSQKQIIGLKRIAPEKLFAYGVVGVEKIAHRLFKIKKIVEKPELGEAPSDLAICGRYILTPEIFDYLKKTPPNKKGEVILAEALNQMIDNGKIVYGYEISGDWLECGKITDWLKSDFHLLLQHPEYGPMLRELVKKIK